MVYCANSSKASARLAATAILFEISRSSSARRGRRDFCEAALRFKAFIQFFQLLTECCNGFMEIRFIAMVLQLYAPYVVFVFRLFEFKLLPKSSDAGSQLTNLRIGCGNCLLDVIAFFKSRFFQLVAQN